MKTKEYRRRKAARVRASLVPMLDSRGTVIGFIIPAKRKGNLPYGPFRTEDDAVMWALNKTVYLKEAG